MGDEVNAFFSIKETHWRRWDLPETQNRTSVANAFFPVRKLPSATGASEQLLELLLELLLLKELSAAGDSSLSSSSSSSCSEAPVAEDDLWTWKNAFASEVLFWAPGRSQRHQCVSFIQKNAFTWFFQQQTHCVATLRAGTQRCACCVLKLLSSAPFWWKMSKRLLYFPMSHVRRSSGTTFLLSYRRRAHVKQTLWYSNR